MLYKKQDWMARQVGFGFLNTQNQTEMLKISFESMQGRFE